MRRKEGRTCLYSACALFCLNVRVPHMAIIYDKELLMAKYIS